MANTKRALITADVMIDPATGAHLVNVVNQAPSKCVFQDAATAPVVSPVANVGTTPQAFAVPAGAATFIFQASGLARYGDNAMLDGSATGKGYKYVPANCDCRVSCSGMTTIYVRADSGAVNIDFMFEVQ
jgi:hypothetical protein